MPATELALTMPQAELGNAHRNFMVTDDTPRNKQEKMDRRVPLSHVVARRLVNQEGTVENQEANERKDQVGGWNVASRKFAQDSADTEHKTTMNGQAHRAKLNRERKEREGAEFGSRSQDRFSLPGDARVSVNNPTAPSNVVQSRPLDPAVDPNRNYFLTSKTHGRRIRTPHNGSQAAPTARPAASRPFASQASVKGPSINAAGKVKVSGRPLPRNTTTAAQNPMTYGSPSAFSQAVKRPSASFLAHVPPGPKPAPNSKAAAAAAKAKSSTVETPKASASDGQSKQAKRQESAPQSSTSLSASIVEHHANMANAPNEKNLTSTSEDPKETPNGDSAPKRILIHGRWYVLDDAVDETPRTDSNKPAVPLPTVTSEATHSATTDTQSRSLKSRVQISQNVSVSTKSLLGNNLLPMARDRATRDRGAESLASSMWASMSASIPKRSSSSIVDVDANFNPRKMLNLARQEPPRPRKPDPQRPNIKKKPSNSDGFKNPFSVPTAAESTLTPSPGYQRPAKAGLDTSKWGSSSDGSNDVKARKLVTYDDLERNFENTPVISSLNESKWAPKPDITPAPVPTPEPAVKRGNQPIMKPGLSASKWAR
ncbi:MAG: hypothetical protein Q9227_000834 [Pyrenula ochraceoflavens]